MIRFEMVYEPCAVVGESCENRHGLSQALKKLGLAHERGPPNTQARDLGFANAKVCSILGGLARVVGGGPRVR